MLFHMVIHLLLHAGTYVAPANSFNITFLPSCSVQIVLEKPSNNKCDVFSYAMVLWEIVHYLEPFDGEPSILVPSMIVTGKVKCC